MKGRAFAVARLVVALVLLAVALFSLPRLISPETPRLGTIEEIRRTLTRFPAHLPAYRRLAELAFELPGSSAIRLWNSAYAMVVKLSPGWPAMRRNFVRQGFFHWSELRDNERALVLREAAVLMRDPQTFTQLHEPLWQLTRDFSYLRAAAPRDPAAWERLVALAARHGDFDEYRRMRGELPRLFVEQLRRKERRNPPADELLGDLMLMERSMGSRDEMAIFMNRLAAAPPTGIGHDPNRLAEFLDFAIRTRLPNLEALVYIAEPDSGAAPHLRARVALAGGNVTLANRIEESSLTRTPEWTPYLIERARFHLGEDPVRAQEVLRLIAPAESRNPAVIAVRAEVAERRGNVASASALRDELQQRFPAGPLDSSRWSQLCDGVLCHGVATATVFSKDPAAVSMTLVSTSSGEVSAYVEIFNGFDRVAEGEVRGARTFDFRVPPGLHQLRIRLINPLDSQGQRRDVRVG